MILEVAAIYDQKARAFLPPIFVAHLDVALRAVSNAANDPSHIIGRNPEDFILFHLGTWSDENSVFTLLGVPVHLAVASKFKGRE